MLDNADLTCFHFVTIVPWMNVIARPAIDAAIQRYPDAAGWLETWWTTAKAARWESLQQVRRDYPSADQVNRCLVFDARGNRYRLIVRVVYADGWQNGTLFVKWFLTHAQYDKGKWKRNCE
jgi:mRNA interferase HigB